MNVASRFATIDALVHEGTYVINDSVFDTFDKVQKLSTGDFYSTKPPVLPTMTAALYRIYYNSTGNAFHNDGVYSAIWFINLLTGFLGHVVFLLYSLLLVRLLFQRFLAQILTFTALGFGHLGVIFAISINNHSIATTLLFAGLYHTLRTRTWVESTPVHLALAGLLLGATATVDFPSFVFAVALGVYIYSLHGMRAGLYFVPPLLVFPAFHLLLSYQSVGTLIPSYIRKHTVLKTRFEGSYWKDAIGIDRLKEPKLLYMFHMTFGHHGVFAQVPLALVGLFVACRDSGQALSKNVGKWSRVRLQKLCSNLSFLFVLCTIALFAMYIYRTNNYGGITIGFRWLIPWMALMVLWSGWCIERTTKEAATLWKAGIYAICIAFVWITLQIQDAHDPWLHSWWYHVWQSNAADLQTEPQES